MKKELLQIIIVSIAVILFSLLYFFYPASGHSFYPKCPFHSLTGLYCPGCGSQRAFSALLKGNIGEASNKNILMVLSLPLIAYSAFIFTWNAFSENKKTQQIVYSPLFVKTLLVVVILFSILRNIPVSPFTWLAP
jgi:hypothetical protein